MSADADVPRGAVRFLYGVGALVSLTSIFQMGYSNAYVNTAIDEFKIYLNRSLETRDVTMTDDTYTWLWSAILNVWFIGFAGGSLIAVPITDTIGRKQGLLIGNVLTLVSVVLLTVSIIYDVFEMLLVGRTIAAVASGIAMCALVLFLQEISPKHIRGSMSFYAELSFVVMNAVGAVLGMSMFLGKHLAVLVGVAAIPAIVSIIAMIPLHESPKFLLLKKGDNLSAKAAVKFYMQLDDENCDRLLESMATESDETHGSIRTLLRVPHLRSGLLLGVLALQVTASIWPVIYYSTEFLRRANIEYDLAETVSSVMLVISTIATVFGMLLMERFSRRNLFIFVSAINIGALALFVLGAELGKHVADGFKYICIVAVIIHGISYSFATGPIAWFLTSELVPIDHRALAQAIALTVNQLIAMCLTFVTLPLYNIIGSFTLFVLYVIPGVGVLIILWFRLPETKNRDISEVVADLKRVRTRVALQTEESISMPTKVQI
uniref:MFS domain-containing protein n=1 Tax=Panagrellus redivivus TaxID=6233 RepID=A0A7E4ZRN4_PANRE